MCTLHIENPSNSVSVQAVQKTHKINGIIYNDSLYTTDLYISAYNILVCETIVDQDHKGCNR